MAADSNIYAVYMDASGETTPLHFSHDDKFGPGIPIRLRKLETMHYGQTVGAVTTSKLSDHVFTGGEGCVKIWDITSPLRPSQAGQFCCWQGDERVRFIKLMPNEQSAIVGGEINNISLWDFGPPSPRKLSELTFGSAGFYALAFNPASQSCYSCGSDGGIVVWDFRECSWVGHLMGHDGGVTCADISSSGTQLWTGGMDGCLRTWDLRTNTQLVCRQFPSRIFALDCSPVSEMLAIGMEDNVLEILSSRVLDRHMISLHVDHVQALKFAASGNWLMSAGEDTRLNLLRISNGADIYQTKDTGSVWSCDISRDEKVIVTGSQDRATLYEVIF